MRRAKQEQTAVFVRLPVEQARRLDRAAAAVGAHKKDLIAGLLAQHVDPDTPQGIDRLRTLASHGEEGSRRILIEEDRGLQRGSAGFNPYAPMEVLDAEGAAALLAVDLATILELAEKGEIPGRRIAGEWRFARHGLLEWLAGSEPASPETSEDPSLQS